MRRFLVAAGLLLFPCLSAWAQKTPYAEVFGGYSYARSQEVGAAALNLNGWNASLQGNVNDWFGVVGDFSGHYRSRTGNDVNLHFFLFGPRLTYRKAERPTPFIHALLGGARGGRGYAGLRDAKTEFAWAIGGGVDVKVHDRVALRVIQADYIQTRFRNTTQNHARLSFGLVIRIGEK